MFCVKSCQVQWDINLSHSIQWPDNYHMKKRVDLKNRTKNTGRMKVFYVRGYVFFSRFSRSHSKWVNSEEVGPFQRRCFFNFFPWFRFLGSLKFKNIVTGMTIPIIPVLLKKIAKSFLSLNLCEVIRQTAYWKRHILKSRTEKPLNYQSRETFPLLIFFK